MHRILILVAVLFLFSCSKEQHDTAILIRVDNQSSKKLEEVRITSFSPNAGVETEKRYGSVPAGQTSSYLSHEEVFTIPLFQFTMRDVGHFELANIPCATGTSSLSPGKYSLIIRGGDYPDVYLEKD